MLGFIQNPFRRPVTQIFSSPHQSIRIITEPAQHPVTAGTQQPPHRCPHAAFLLDSMIMVYREAASVARGHLADGTLATLTEVQGRILALTQPISGHDPALVLPGSRYLPNLTLAREAGFLPLLNPSLGQIVSAMAAFRFIHY
jgi:hypothetical protein